MEKRKINIITIIVICIVSITIGIGIGYFIYKGLNKTVASINIEDENTQKLTEKPEIIVRNEEIKTTAINEININNSVSKVKYDGSKTINISGKTYTISYLTNVFQDDDNYEQTEIKLFLNDEKVKSLKLYNTVKDRQQGSYEVELYNFDKEYILIAIKTRIDDKEYDGTNAAKFCIININGEHIDTLEWSDATKISSVKNGKQLTYEINNDGIILYESTYNGAMKMKYTVIRDILKEELLELYKENEDVYLSGK